MLARLIAPLLFAVLGAWGIRNLSRAIERSAPHVRYARLLNGFCGLSFAAALFAVPVVRLILISTGIASAGAWLYMVYKLSLHNTTM